MYNLIILAHGKYVKYTGRHKCIDGKQLFFYYKWVVIEANYNTYLSLKLHYFCL